MYVVYVSSSSSQKSNNRCQRARARGESLHLSFVLSFVENHRGSRLRFRRRVARDKSEKKKEKTVVSQSFGFGFLCQNRREKDPKKKLKSYHFLTLLYSSANDNTIHINIKTVWRAWMNSKSPKAEETKGTEI